MKNWFQTHNLSTLSVSYIEWRWYFKKRARSLSICLPLSIFSLSIRSAQPQKAWALSVTFGKQSWPRVVLKNVHKHPKRSGIIGFYFVVEMFFSFYFSAHWTGSSHINARSIDMTDCICAQIHKKGVRSAFENICIQKKIIIIITQNGNESIFAAQKFSTYTKREP